MQAAQVPLQILLIGALLLSAGCSAPSTEIEEHPLGDADIPRDEIQAVDPRLLAEIETYAAKWATEYTLVIMADFLETPGECQVLLSEDSYYRSEGLAAHFPHGDLLIAIYDSDRRCFDRFVSDRISAADLNRYESFESTQDREVNHPVYRLIQFASTRNNFIILREMLSG